MGKHSAPRHRRPQNSESAFGRWSLPAWAKRLAHRGQAAAPAASAASSTSGSLRSREPAPRGKGRERRLAAPLIATLAALAVLLTAGLWYVAVRDGQGAATASETAQECARTVPLRVTADPSIVPALREITPLVAERPAPGGKLCADLAVEEALSADAAAKLGGRDPGEFPDVWIPDSSRWVALAAGTKQGAARIKDDDPPVVALSPVVVAMRRADAERLGATKSYFGWPQLRAAQQAEGADNLRVALPDPARSAAGMVTLQAVADKTRLGNEFTAEALPTLRMPLIVQSDLEKVLPDVTAGSVTASATSERELLRYNADTSGDLVGARVGRPSLGLALDYRVVPIENGDAVEPDRAEAIEALTTALQSEPGQQALRSLHLRPASGTPLPSSTPSGITGVAIKPPRSAVDGITPLMRAWANAGRRGRLLVVYDVSGSMGARVPGSRATKLRMAVKAGRRAFEALAPDTDLALWTFSTKLEGDKDYRKLLRNDALGSRHGGVIHRDEAIRVLANVKIDPDGGTGLYDTTLAAFRTAQRAYTPGRLNSVVLLTDGRNGDDESIGRQALLDTLRREWDPQRPVRMITIGYGANADTKIMRRISKATGGRSCHSRDPADIDRILLEALTKL
ncbi:MAG: substrate-binding and VWA domain-containing protein [Actinomycetota bacterium]|nr:substrate-binding and VWA domain-containing protein [Actinomycetota bacterium]